MSSETMTTARTALNETRSKLENLTTLLTPYQAGPQIPTPGTMKEAHGIIDELGNIFDLGITYQLETPHDDPRMIDAQIISRLIFELFQWLPDRPAASPPEQRLHDARIAHLLAGAISTALDRLTWITEEEEAAA